MTAPGALTVNAIGGGTSQTPYARDITALSSHRLLISIVKSDTCLARLKWACRHITNGKGDR